jgi:hypothetical protein
MVGERGSVSGKLKRANYAMGRNVRRSPGRGLVMCKRPRSLILEVLAKKWEVCGRGSGSCSRRSSRENTALIEEYRQNWIRLGCE